MNATNPQRSLPRETKKPNHRPAVAKVVQKHWARRLNNECALCGHQVENGTCPQCGTVAGSSVTLLEKMDPEVHLVRQECPRCHKVMIFKAGFVLRILKRSGKFRSSFFLCRQCLKKKKSASAPQKAPAPKRVAVTPVLPLPEPIQTQVAVVAPKVPAAETYYSTPGFACRPFQALSELRIEKRE